MLSPVSTHEGHTPVSDLNCMLRVGRGPRCAPWTSSSASPGMKAAGKARCQVPPGCSTQRPARVERRTGQQSRRRRSVGERPVSQRTRSQADVGNTGKKMTARGAPGSWVPPVWPTGFSGPGSPPSPASVSTLLLPPRQLVRYSCVARSPQLHWAAHQEEDSQTRGAVPGCGVQESGLSPAFPVIVMHSDV